MIGQIDEDDRICPDCGQPMSSHDLEAIDIDLVREDILKNTNIDQKSKEQFELADSLIAEFEQATTLRFVNNGLNSPQRLYILGMLLKNQIISETLARKDINFPKTFCDMLAKMSTTEILTQTFNDAVHDWKERAANAPINNN